MTGSTCEDIVDSARTIDESSDVCVGLQYVEALCCPSAASTCSICKGTKLLADVEVLSSLSAGLTKRNCVQIAFDAAEYEATSVDCVDHQQSYEVYCCQDDETHPSSSSIKPPQIPPFFRYVFTLLLSYFDGCIPGCSSAYSCTSCILILVIHPFQRGTIDSPLCM